MSDHPHEPTFTDDEIGPPSDSAPVESPPSCPACGAERSENRLVCDDCGLIFPVTSDTEPSTPADPVSETLIAGRYRLGEVVGERAGLVRFIGQDLGDGESSPVPVQILRQRIPESDADTDADTDASPEPTWPSVEWERHILETADHPALPDVLENFVEEGYAYLVERWPEGTSLWDAWEAPERSARERYGLLIPLAEALRALVKTGAQFEGLSPDCVVVTPSGVVLRDLTDLIPLPAPPELPLRGTYSSAPELLLSPDAADGRAALYGFGAMLYALLLGRELTDIDFVLQGEPKPYGDRFPDAHPLLGRTLGKTFCRDPDRRFPTSEVASIDPSGITELIWHLESCGQQLDRFRFDVAACTSTGMHRTGNEDTVTVLFDCRCAEEDRQERALLVLADGMGGMERGEVAAALAVRSLIDSLCADPDPDANLDELGQIGQAIEIANRTVYETSRSEEGAGGMGCTAEVVWLEGREVWIGHVGDSRVYLWRGGRLELLTDDQTLVNRMVKFGQLTAEEAEDHPRRSELHQAIGGYATVEPELIHRLLRGGDRLLVCSDGLTNQLDAEQIGEILAEARSATMAARRLVNAANVDGALDNVTAAVAIISE